MLVLSFLLGDLQIIHEDLFESLLRTSRRAKDEVIFERGEKRGGGGHLGLGVEKRGSVSRILYGSHVGLFKLDSVGK